MSKSLHIFLPYTQKELLKIIEDYQSDFDEILKEEFSEDELESLADSLDTLASVDVTSRTQDVTIDDFEIENKDLPLMSDAFGKTKSVLVFDELPFLDTHPLQVTYLKNLLWSFREGIVDRGGVNKLIFLKDYLLILKKYKGMDALNLSVPEVQKVVIPGPTDPLSVIYELVLNSKISEINHHSEKMKMIFHLIRNQKISKENLFKESRLSLKDFGDEIERLRIYLKNN